MPGRRWGGDAGVMLVQRVGAVAMAVRWGRSYDGSGMSNCEICVQLRNRSRCTGHGDNKGNKNNISRPPEPPI
jgi:hypothetical protein